MLWTLGAAMSRSPTGSWPLSPLACPPISPALWVVASRRPSSSFLCSSYSFLVAYWYVVLRYSPRTNDKAKLPGRNVEEYITF